MKNEIQRLTTRGIVVGIVATVLLAPSAMQAGPPSLSSNPGKHVIFPAKGQTPEQQKLDEAAAYDWATQQTGWDPYQEYDKLVQKGYAAAETSDAAKGGAVKGAAGGALLGVVIGAIAGDAGKGAATGAAAGGLTGGARSHRTKKAAGAEAEAAVAEYKQQFAFWDRNFVAALEGKGYTVKQGNQHVATQEVHSAGVVGAVGAVRQRRRRAGLAVHHLSCRGRG